MQSALHISTMPCFTAFEKEPVKESEFEAYVEGMHGNGNHGFSLEYSVIILFKPLFSVCIVSMLAAPWKRSRST